MACSCRGTDSILRPNLLLPNTCNNIYKEPDALFGAAYLPEAIYAHNETHRLTHIHTYAHN